ncbi:hypothetical protein CLV46_1184 [Diaminobutyricimonas aerilata]|uniref:Cell wall hydrolase n=1 Tax=Diaminobutyricimonas aerilata TaxID=1162967 RepID=A0A2M9CI93_9MICO|nr:hypothetical protein [Diaminobutyricimonas aerilata]PJJ71633.1 hypothetical protein CLV46_1184 [Diaminobutyricimonas aerilata]
MTRGSLVRIGAAVAAVVALGGTALVTNQPEPTAAQKPVAALQSFTVPADAPAQTVQRDDMTATDMIAQLAASGTNRDWATMVLVYGGWPTTESNVTVMMRWMRQENYEKNWWQRNNPLNNGFGSGGGSGLGSYDNLVIAAQKAAENLHRGSGYRDIVAGFAASAPTEQIESAIWASPWASSHYQNGAHWHYHPADVVKAPAEAWG